MGRKNAYLTQMQRQQDTRMLNMGTVMMQWSTQVAVDALIKTLGYGACMKNDPWGEQRILALAEEWLANIDHIWGGISRQPDADAIRRQTDTMLKKKIPSAYGPWEQRYIEWTEDTLSREVSKFRGLWKKQGLLDNDGGTSQLLKGVGK